MQTSVMTELISRWRQCSTTSQHNKGLFLDIFLYIYIPQVAVSWVTFSDWRLLISTLIIYTVDANAVLRAHSSVTHFMVPHLGYTIISLIIIWIFLTVLLLISLYVCDFTVRFTMSYNVCTVLYNTKY